MSLQSSVFLSIRLLLASKITALLRAPCAHAGSPREAAARKGFSNIIASTATPMLTRMPLRHLRFALILRTVKGGEGNAIFSASENLPTRVAPTSRLHAGCSPKKYRPELASSKKRNVTQVAKKSNDPRSALQPHQLRGDEIPKP